MSGKSWLVLLIGLLAYLEANQYVYPSRNDQGPGGSLARTCSGVNKVWLRCASTCPLTCANLNKRPQQCPRECRPGCDCQRGYVLNRWGQCVRRYQCGRKLGPDCLHPNEKYSDCGTSCEVTCDNYRSPPLKCTMDCNPGCFCKRPFIRRRPGECVLPKSCDTLEVDLGLQESQYDQDGGGADDIGDYN